MRPGKTFGGFVNGFADAGRVGNFDTVIFSFWEPLKGAHPVPTDKRGEPFWRVGNFEGHNIPILGMAFPRVYRLSHIEVEALVADGLPR